DWPGRRAYDTAWQRMLHDAGYAGLHWPVDPDRPVFRRCEGGARVSYDPERDDRQALSARHAVNPVCVDSF
ncbi:hypothetical protein ACWCQE_31730, partial [Streptomyces sp. NPDC002409]